jgi:acylphosphatase
MNGGRTSPSTTCRRRIVFLGRVQGVGFRYTTASLAKQYHIKGYVRNRPGGSVELCVEGSQEDVRRLLERLNEEFAGNIERQTEEEAATSSEQFVGFEIRH